jgi:hypothetical protein
VWKRGKQLGIKPASENPRDFFEIAPVLIGLAPPIRPRFHFTHKIQFSPCILIQTNNGEAQQVTPGSRCPQELKRGKQLGIKPASENPRDFFEIAPVLIGLAPPINMYFRDIAMCGLAWSYRWR